jgi:hypothetical protein
VVSLKSDWAFQLPQEIAVLMLALCVLVSQFGHSMFVEHSMSRPSTRASPMMPGRIG